MTAQFEIKRGTQSENFKSTRIVATRDSNSIRMEMSRVANVSFITHDDAPAALLPRTWRIVHAACT